MRPIRLVMQAFGPYAETQILNMDVLGETGIYAITGETGAGKTTIFDAIVYALYGSGSGEDRKDGKGLRALAASPDLETKVELEFLSGGKIYTVIRKPEQYLAGKRKNELVKKAASQVLIMDDGKKVYTKGSEIDGTKGCPGIIEKEILGVTKEQFCQIVMIAQGEFRRLLRADTAERTVILRRIFRTERFDRLGRQMDQACKEKYSEWENALDQASFALKSLQSDPQSPLYDELVEKQKIEAKALPIDAVLDLACRISKVDEEEARTAKSDLERTEQVRDTIRKSLDRENELAVKRKSLENLRNTLDDLHQQFEKAEQQRLLAEHNLPEIDQLARMITTEVNQLPKYVDLANAELKRKQIDKKLTELRQKKESIENKSTELKQKQIILLQEAEAKGDAADRLLKASEKLSKVKVIGEKLEKLRRRLEIWNSSQQALKTFQNKLVQTKSDEEAAIRVLHTLEKEQDELGNTELALQQIEVQLNELENSANRIIELKNLQMQYQKSMELYHAAKKVFANKEADWQQLDGEAKRLRRHYNMNLAGVLAKELVEGVPCPVCGSTQHPCKAAFLGEDVTEDAVIQTEEKAEKAKMAFNEQAADCRVHKANCEGFYQQLKDKLPEISEDGWLVEIERRLKENANTKRQIAEKRRIALTRGKRNQLLRDDLLPKAQENRDVAQKARIDANTTVKNAEDRLLLAEMEVKDAAIGVMPEGWTALDLSDSISVNDRAKNNLEEIVKIAESDKIRLAAIEREKESVDTELEQVGNAIHAAEVSEAQLSADLESVLREIEAMRLDLPYTNKENCTRAIEEKRVKKKEMEDAIVRTHKEIHELSMEIAGAEGKIKTLEDDLKGVPQTDLDALKQEYSIAQTAYETSNLRERKAQIRRISNERQRKMLAEQAILAKQFEKEFNIMQDVCDTVRGNVSGNHIPLETYVQTTFFDHILNYANQRLIHMSRQQYDLARQSVEDGVKRGKTGLELDVVDHANGQRRAVGTLSGGESFLASLSFALGLSDAIQANSASAVQLDTMFVDEGFGSLSENYLTLVMDELNDTANSGHRLIGIISHVDDVKDSIDRQIKVTKSAGGISRAEIQ